MLQRENILYIRLQLTRSLSMGNSLLTYSIDKIHSALNTDGFVFLKNFGEKNVVTRIHELGTIIMTTDVTVSSEKRNLVNSSLALDFHTDHHKARYIAWYCYKQTDLGGESKLVDARTSYEQLPEDYKKRLQEIHLFEHKIFDDDSESIPLVTLIDEKPHFYYSFWLVKEEDKQDPAFVAFRKGLANNHFLKLRLEEDDLLIIDNHRILHGRTAIKGSQDRFLKRFWIA